MHDTGNNVVDLGSDLGIGERRAGGAAWTGCGERALLCRLRDGRVDVEGAAKPDNAEQEHERDWQNQGGFRDLGARVFGEFG